MAHARIEAVDTTEAASMPGVLAVYTADDLGPEHGSNLAIEFNFGDDPSIFDDADVVVEGRFLNQRLAPVPMEPNGILVELDGDDGLTLHVPTQNPHGVRDPLAGVVGLEEEQVRVVATTVGGGFGAKAGMYPEFGLVATAARKLGRPLKWSETRSESMVAMTHGRGQIQYVELGMKRDGTFTGLRGRIVCDGGAYPGIGAFLPYLTRTMSQGVYRIPSVQMNSKSAITNTTPTAAYRGAGRPEAAALLERIVDMAAVELGRDPVDLRKQNFLRPEEFPLTTVTGANYDSADYVKALDEACLVAGYGDDGIALAPDRRQRDPQDERARRRQGQAAGGAPARGRRRRHRRARGRRRRRGRGPRHRALVGGARHGGRRPGSTPGRLRGGPAGRARLQPGRSHLPLRCPHRGGRGRHRDRARRAAAP